ncbi:MAG: hypothetical protein AAF922_14025 [Pseudomonadota bacterium]
MAAPTLRKMERQLALASAAFGSKPIDRIKAPDILPVLEEISAKGARLSTPQGPGRCSPVFLHGLLSEAM